MPLYCGQFVWSQKCQTSYIPYLYNTDTSVKRTLGSVPLVSVLKRFDCIKQQYLLPRGSRLSNNLSWPRSSKCCISPAISVRTLIKAKVMVFHNSDSWKWKLDIFPSNISFHLILKIIFYKTWNAYHFSSLNPLYTMPISTCYPSSLFVNYISHSGT